MSIDDLIKRIPRSYKEVPYLKYIQIMQILPDGQIAELIESGEYDEAEYNTYVQYEMLSILLDVPVSELTTLPATAIISLLTAINFMNVQVSNVTSNIEVKTVEEITYNEYVSYNTLMQNNDKWQSMPQLLSMLIKNKTQAEIDQLSIYDVMGFFLRLKIGLQKSTLSFQLSLALKIIKLRVKEIMKKIFNLVRVF
jgi:hypothetical protein